MKLLILLALTLSTAWAKPLVLITYYDAFGKAPFNNSERIARALESRLNAENSEIEIKLCGLNTIFDVAFAQSENCLKALKESPVMVIGLGESTCQLKIETMMRNNDKTYGPDNAGNRRDNRKIISEASSAVGLRYPLPEMYCALTKEQRRTIDLSNDAGSFVCNNTAFQMSYFHPEISYGFIHVPTNNCGDLQRRSESAVLMLEQMILRGVTYLLDNDIQDTTMPHSSNDIRLPTKLEDLKKLRKEYKDDPCLSEYFKKSAPYSKER